MTLQTIGLTGFVLAFGELLVEFLASGNPSCLVLPLFYAPGYAVLKVVTLGRYPPEFYAEDGRAVCYLVGFGLWAAAFGVVIAVLM